MELVEIAKKLGCSTTAIRARVKAGWTESEVINTPPKSNSVIRPDVEKFIIISKNKIEFSYEYPPKSSSKTWVLCPICKIEKCILRVSLERTLKKNSSYICTLCKSRSEAGRLQRSKQTKKAWTDENFRKTILLKNEIISRSDQGRAQRSKQAKEAWTDGQYRALQEKRTSEIFKSEEHRKFVSERNKKDFSDDPEKYRRVKVSVLHTEQAKKAHKAALANAEYRETHRKLAKKRFEDPVYKAKIASGLENFPRGGRMSKPEMSIKDILTEMGVEFTYNKPLGPYNFDFYVEKFDLFIEVQGEYWHTLPNNERRDKSKYTYLRQCKPESKIIYIWDYDISIGLAKSKLAEAMGLATLPTLDFDFDRVHFKQISQDEAKRFLSSWHYAQFGKKGKFILAAVLDDKIIAVAKIGPVSRKEIATTIDGTPKDVYELDRFCIHPMRQKKNFASYFLSRVTSNFFSLFSESKQIIAFSDETLGHSGTIYKACNWKECGRVKPDYIYVRNDGWMMHKKTLYNQAKSVHMSERDYAEKNGWEKIFGKEKKKFVLSRVREG